MNKEKTAQEKMTNTRFLFVHRGARFSVEAFKDELGVCWAEVCRDAMKNHFNFFCTTTQMRVRTHTHTHARVHLHERPGYARSGPMIQHLGL
jgi:hypothetical protein